MPLDQLLKIMGGFLERTAERQAVLGDDGHGSETLKRIVERA